MGSNWTICLARMIEKFQIASVHWRWLSVEYPVHLASCHGMVFVSVCVCVCVSLVICTIR